MLPIKLTPPPTPPFPRRHRQGLYEAELNDARKLLDETAKEKAHLQIEVGKWKAEADDLAAKLAKRDAEADALHKSLKDAEKKISVSWRLSVALRFSRACLPACLPPLTLTFSLSTPLLYS